MQGINCESSVFHFSRKQTLNGFMSGFMISLQTNEQSKNLYLFERLCLGVKLSPSIIFSHDPLHFNRAEAEVPSWKYTQRDHLLLLTQDFYHRTMNVEKRLSFDQLRLLF